MSVLIWPIHCPRTGVTSIKIHCEALKKRGLIEFEKTAHRRYKPGEHERLKAKYSKVIALTILRDPVEHTLSLFSYVRADRNNPGYKQAKSLSFSQWLDNWSDVEYFIRYYGSGDIDIAESNLRQFDHILNTESLKSDFNNVLNELGLPTNFDRHAHKGDVQRYVAKQDDIKKIKRVRKRDYELLSRLGITYK
jgi:hypothetical protein